MWLQNCSAQNQSCHSFRFNRTNGAGDFRLNKLTVIGNRQTEWWWISFPLEKGHHIQGKKQKTRACDSEFLPDFIFKKILLSTNGNYLLFIQDVFCRTDVDKSGTLSLTELRNALMAAGRRKYQSVRRDTTFHLPGSQQPNLLLYRLFALKLLFL